MGLGELAKEEGSEEASFKKPEGVKNEQGRHAAERKVTEGGQQPAGNGYGAGGVAKTNDNGDNEQ